MRQVSLFLLGVLCLCLGSVIALVNVAVIGFQSTIVYLAICYGGAIIGGLILLGIKLTQNYLLEKENHRIIMERFRKLQ